MRITPAQIDMWFRCPKMYWWRYVEKIQKPPFLPAMWEGCILSALLMCMKRKAEEDELPKLDEMVETVMSRWRDGIVRLEKPPRDGSMDMYFARAMTICNEFLTRDMAIMTPTDVGLLKFENVVWPSGKGSHELMAPVHVLDGNQIGMIDVRQHPGVKKYAEADPYLVCATIASGIPHYWHLTISVKRGAAFKKLHGYMPEGRQLWYKRIINELAEAMESGPYTPCHPGEFHCHQRGCPYFYECRGTADVKGRVTRV